MYLYNVYSHIGGSEWNLPNIQHLKLLNKKLYLVFQKIYWCLHVNCHCASSLNIYYHYMYMNLGRHGQNFVVFAFNTQIDKWRASPASLGISAWIASPSLIWAGHSSAPACFCYISFSCQVCLLVISLSAERSGFQLVCTLILLNILEEKENICLKKLEKYILKDNGTQYVNSTQAYHTYIGELSLF